MSENYSWYLNFLAFVYEVRWPLTLLLLAALVARTVRLLTQPAATLPDARVVGKGGK